MRSQEDTSSLDPATGMHYTPETGTHGSEVTKFMKTNLNLKYFYDHNTRSYVLKKTFIDAPKSRQNTLHDGDDIPSKNLQKIKKILSHFEKLKSIKISVNFLKYSRDNKT